MGFKGVAKQLLENVARFLKIESKGKKYAPPATGAVGS